MKFSLKVLESILRKGKAQREHTSWKLKNFKITQTPEDTEWVRKGWRKSIVPAEKTWLRCCLWLREEQTFSQALSACTLSAFASLSSEKLLTLLTMQEYPWQCPVLGSLGKNEVLTSHSAWVSETKEKIGTKSELVTYLSTQQQALGSFLEATWQWKLFWEYYGSWFVEKLLQTFHPSLSLCSLSAREKSKKEKAAAQSRE